LGDLIDIYINISIILITCTHHWRSRQKWFTGANSAAWLHKRPFRRSLYLKGLLPQAQTLPIIAEAAELPKPSRLRRSLAQTASRIAAATIGTMLLTSHAMAGGFWLQRADGWIYVPDELLIVFIGAVVAAVAVIAVACSDQSKPSATFSEYLPEEVRAPESVEYYDDMTARARGLKRQLDADTELAESYIKARRAKAELEDLDSEARRHARGRQ
jgi:hypothetical protein